MYLRTTRRKNKDGSTVTYYHLAHNKRYSETGHPDSLQLLVGQTKSTANNWFDCATLYASVCELTIEDSTSPLEQSQQQKKWVEDLKLVQSRELGTVAVIEALWE